MGHLKKQMVCTMNVAHLEINSKQKHYSTFTFTYLNTLLLMYINNILQVCFCPQQTIKYLAPTVGCYVSMKK